MSPGRKGHFPHMTHITEHDLEDAFNTARREFSKEIDQLRDSLQPRNVENHPAVLTNLRVRVEALERAVEEIFTAVDGLIHGQV